MTPEYRTKSTAAPGGANFWAYIYDFGVNRRPTSCILNFWSIYKQEHSAYRAQTFARGNPVRIRTLDLDNFKNLTGTFLSKDTCDKIFIKIRLVFPKIWASVANALSRNVEKSFKKIMHSDPDDFQTLISFSLSTYQISSFYVKLITYIQTDRQTDKTPGKT